LYSNIDENPDGSADWRFSKEAMIQSVVQGRAQDHWRELRALSMPTLVVRGSESEDLTKDEFQRMCLANPRIHGVEIPQAGHWVHFDRPQEFLQALLDFVK
jgi:pimeloyl-ACP methyl ester carboxylesterase